jgi:hypothetical protein
LFSNKFRDSCEKQFGEGVWVDPGRWIKSYGHDLIRPRHNPHATQALRSIIIDRDLATSTLDPKRPITDLRPGWLYSESLSLSPIRAIHPMIYGQVCAEMWSRPPGRIDPTGPRVSGVGRARRMRMRMTSGDPVSVRVAGEEHARIGLWWADSQ